LALDRSVFVRPIAHRGLHDLAAGRIENTAPAFLAAIGRGYGIECDLQAASDGTPMVFHDETLDRLVDATGRLSERSPAELRRLRYKGQDAELLAYGDFLDLCGGRVPLLVEIKSDWGAPHAGFLERIAALTSAYKGPVALMSFDPEVMARVAVLAPNVPRGIVSGAYKSADGDDWWADRLSPTRRFRLRHLLESGPASPSFFAYHVVSLRTPVVRFARAVMGVPIFTWTVRTLDDRHQAARWADAMIFEGFEPAAEPRD
jgi:glycerophosphoryl diester phosphodiesterase